MEDSEPTPPKLRCVHIENQHVAKRIANLSLPQRFPTTLADHSPPAKEHSLISPRISRNGSDISLVISNFSRNSNIMSVSNNPDGLHRDIRSTEERIIRVSSLLETNEIKILPKTTSAPIFSKGRKEIKNTSPAHLLTTQSKNSESSTNGEPQCILKELKLKSPDREDLGLFNVLFVEKQHENVLLEKFVSVMKHVPRIDKIGSTSEGKPKIIENCYLLRNGDLDDEFVSGELKDVCDLETEEGNVIHSRQLKEIQSEHGSSTGWENVMANLPNRTENELSRQSCCDSSSDFGSLRLSDEEDELGSSENPIVIQNNVHLMTKNPENVFAVKEGSPDMSVVERAFSTIQDITLREKALRALATYKLRRERQVSVLPQSNTTSVRDAMTQTKILGNCKSCNTILTPVNENHTGDLYMKQLDISEIPEIKRIKRVLIQFNRSNEKINNIKTLLEQCVKMLTDYDENGFLGLHKSVMEGNSIAVKRFLLIIKFCKKNIDVKTLAGKTSLELAIETDADPDIVHDLLEAGAKPTSEETHNSALMIASKNRSPLLPKLVRYAKNQTLDSVDSEGFTALHLCASRGNVDGVNALISAGANINLQDRRSGKTALFYASQYRYPEAVRALLVAGATPDIPANVRKTINQC